jgi:hypothetical protein
VKVHYQFLGEDNSTLFHRLEKFSQSETSRLCGCGSLSSLLDIFEDDKRNDISLMQKPIEVKPEIIFFVSSSSHISLTLCALKLVRHVVCTIITYTRMYAHNIHAYPSDGEH